MGKRSAFAGLETEKLKTYEPSWTREGVRQTRGEGKRTNEWLRECGGREECVCS